MKSENIWQSISCDGIFEMMRLLRCEKKYIDGTASDFECLREFLSLCSYAKGHAAVVKAAKKTSELFGTLADEEYLRACCAKDLWKAFEQGEPLPINTDEN